MRDDEDWRGDFALGQVRFEGVYACCSIDRFRMMVKRFFGRLKIFGELVIKKWGKTLLWPYTGDKEIATRYTQDLCSQG